MSTLRSLARNREVYGLIFEKDSGKQPFQDAAPEPESLPDYRAAAAPPEDTAVYRLSHAPGDITELAYAPAGSAGWSSPPHIPEADADRLVDRLLRRLEGDARLYTQDLEDD